jgi:hypothetical protein
MSVDESFVEKLQKQPKEKLHKLKEEKEEKQIIIEVCKYFAFVVYVSRKRSAISFSYLLFFFFS